VTSISFLKRVFPFGDFLLRRKRLAPCMIGRQIFEFLISGSADIQHNKRQIFCNIDVRVELKNVKN
jgi:hypothetical protein